MTQFLQAIGDAFSSILALITNLVVGSFQLVQMIPVGLTYLITSINYMPSVFAAAAIALVTCSVVYLVVGR